MKIPELHYLLLETARLAAQHFVNELRLPPLLKQSEAHRLFGRGNIERWLAEKRITRNGKKYDRKRLETLAAGTNRTSYLTVKARNVRAIPLVANG
ncbi:MAG: hypothetical protein JKY70_01150 [Mucilaginibacter sp.]|nr:hypothetical protein [Mucilaginibacter sp.]